MAQDSEKIRNLRPEQNQKFREIRDRPGPKARNFEIFGPDQTMAKKNFKVSDRTRNKKSLSIPAGPDQRWFGSP